MPGYDAADAPARGEPEGFLSVLSTATNMLATPAHSISNVVRAPSPPPSKARRSRRAECASSSGDGLILSEEGDGDRRPFDADRCLPPLQPPLAAADPEELRLPYGLFSTRSASQFRGAE